MPTISPDHRQDQARKRELLASIVSDPKTVDDLYAWLSTAGADREFKPQCCEHCVLAKYLHDIGYSNVLVGEEGAVFSPSLQCLADPSPRMTQFIRNFDSFFSEPTTGGRIVARWGMLDTEG